MKPVPGWRRLRGERDNVDEELRHHIEGRVEEYVAAGESHEEAWKHARARFGDIERTRAACAGEDTRRMQRIIRTTRKELMISMLQDLKLAARVLAKRPGYTAAVLATLVLSIGATTAIFSVVNGVLLQPLPHPNPEELVLVYEVDRRPGFFEDRNFVTVANFGDWGDQNRVFTQMAGFRNFLVTFRGESDPERVMAGFGSANFFSILGVEPALGRTFLPEEDVRGSDDVVVLAHNFWVTRMGADPEVVGRTITVGSSNVTVVGVLPNGFEFLDTDFEFWFPIALRESAFQNRRSHTMRVVARMNPGVTLEGAQRDMDRVVDGLRAEYPQFLKGWGVNVVSLTDEVVGEIRPALLVLLGAVGLVLLIAAVNVANLMLARTAADQRELAIRTALGAGRHRLVRQQLTESTLLAVVGGALGLLLATGATRLMLTFAPENLPHVDQIGVDARVLAFAIVVSLATGFLFGIVPALQASRTDASATLREGGRSATASVGHRRLRAGFVVSQLALSLVLLISAGLMMSTFARLMRVDPGFDAGGVMTMKITVPTATYPTVTEQSAFYDELLVELENLPGVTSVGATNLLPFTDSESTWSVQIEGQPLQQDGEKRDYGYHAVSSGYFRTMGITLKRGRHFTDFDKAGAPPVMIANEALVHRFFPNGEDPIGQRMSILGREDIWMEIIGVVGDVNHRSLDTDALGAYYGPIAQVPWDWFVTSMNLTLRTAGDPVTLVPSVRSTLRDVGNAVAIHDVLPMEQRVVQSVARSRFAMILLVTFAGVALALALVGIYGVISYSVGQRAQEIGLRMALGAEPSTILRLVIGQGMALALGGIVAGVVIAATLTRFQASLLFGIDSADPLTYAGLSLLLGAVALLATYLPARRASKMDPMRALRE
ncbi:MAG: ABC transporter permease [Gemmatimonadetes bacterium]|nr:ABC transporter permease [Gemmatimonadota bacterium]